MALVNRQPIRRQVSVWGEPRRLILDIVDRATVDELQEHQETHCPNGGKYQCCVDRVSSCVGYAHDNFCGVYVTAIMSGVGMLQRDAERTVSHVLDSIVFPTYSWLMQATCHCCMANCSLEGLRPKGSHSHTQPRSQAFLLGLRLGCLFCATSTTQSFLPETTRTRSSSSSPMRISASSPPHRNSYYG